MKTAQRIAEESGKEEMSITYDLAIAKLLFKYKQENLQGLIMYSSHAIGKFIAENGGPTLLTECGVIANGSLENITIDVRE